MKISGRFFDVYLGGVRQGELPRVQITVSAKVSKKAVDRNLIKRRLREIIKLLGVGYCLNIKIIVIPNALKAKFSELKEDFMSAIAKFNEATN